MRHPLRPSIAFLSLLSVAPIARAEAQSIGFGLMAGGSLSTFTGDLAEDAKNYGGFIAGAFVHLSAMGFAVEPGVFYTQKGAKSKDEESNTVTNKLNYIQIPLVIKLRLPFIPGTRLYVGGGPAIGVNVGCHFTVTTSSGNDGLDEDCDKDVGSGELATPNTELSAIGVGGLEFGKFALGVRADFGVSKTFKELIDNPSNPALKTRTISAVASIRF